MVHLLPGEIIPGYYLRYNVRKSVHKNYPNQYNTIIVYVWKKVSHNLFHIYFYLQQRLKQILNYDKYLSLRLPKGENRQNTVL